MKTRGKMMKIIALTIISCCICFAVSACINTTDNKSNKNDIFGPSVDGIEMTGNWEFGDGTFLSKAEENESVAFSKTMLRNYFFGYMVKADEVSYDADVMLGGYAYYEDKDHYVQYGINPTNHTLNIKSVHGFDTDERTNVISEDFDFSDFVAIRVEKIGKQIKFLIDEEVVQSRLYDYESSAQVGFVNRYVSASYKDYAFEELDVFTDAQISSKAHVILNREGNPSKQWEEEDSTIYNDSTDVWQTYLFEGQSTNMSLDVDILMTTFAGADPLAGITVYSNSSNWCSFFFGPNGAEVYLCEKTYAGWTGGGKFEYSDGTPVNLRIEKKGSKVQFIVNGELFKAFDDETFVNAMFGIESKHIIGKIEVNDLKEIEEFSVDYNFDLMPRTNFTGEYIDDAFIMRSEKE